jgi:hypothetical protein
MSRNRLREAMAMAFSQRDSVGWLARSWSAGERSATSMETGSARSGAWSFWSAEPARIP